MAGAAVTYNVSPSNRIGDLIKAANNLAENTGQIVINFNSNTGIYDLPAIKLKAGNELIIRGEGLSAINLTADPVFSVDTNGVRHYYAIRGFYVDTGTVRFQNLNMSGFTAQGGAGGNPGGGGGAGLGGAIFVGSNASVTLDNVGFSNNSAKGGNGGVFSGTTLGGGGGGGMGGDGGDGHYTSTNSSGLLGGGQLDLAEGGGGGGLGPSSDGADGGPNAFVQNPGLVILDNAGGNYGGQIAGTAGQIAAGNPNGSGGGLGGEVRSFPGAGIGATLATTGGGGGFGGGGGGAAVTGTAAGNGGFGGGGGASGYSHVVAGDNTPLGFYGNGGNGGFGGGGGAGGTGSNLFSSVAGIGGFGAGNGSTLGGGGGLGAGGNVFVQNGGTLTILSGNQSGGSAIGGQAFDTSKNGNGLGSGIFYQGSSLLTLAPESGKTLTISGTIADLSGNGGSGALSLRLAGEGTVVLGKEGYAYSPAITTVFGVIPETPRYNQISGNVEIHSGTLKLLGYGALGTASISITGASTIYVDGNAGVEVLNKLILAADNAAANTGLITINITGSLALNSPLTPINLAAGNSLLIQGTDMAGQVTTRSLSGGARDPGGFLPVPGSNVVVYDPLGAEGQRGFFVYNGNVTLSHLSLNAFEARGGTGGGGAGGGAGLGGGLFVAAGTNVTLDTVSFSNNRANGGAASITGLYGGGGGMGGNGGDYLGGGGGFGRSATGGSASSNVNGNAGELVGALAAGTGTGGVGGALAGGGGAGISAGGILLPGGGGGTPAALAFSGGFGGGGGFAGLGFGFFAGGGFGGGGGAAFASEGGVGGFGGGGGQYAAGGFGGGAGASFGGGGLGAGGDIFVQEGGTVTIRGSGTAADSAARGGSANGGGGGDGAGLGSSLFLQGNQGLTYAPGAGQTQTVRGTIADQTGSGGSGVGYLILNGPGTLVLTASNSFTGGVVVNGGTLRLEAVNAAGTGVVRFGTSGQDVLEVTSGALLNFNFGNTLADFAVGDYIHLVGMGATSAVALSDQIKVLNGDNTVVTFTASGLAAGTNLMLLSDGAGGSLVTLSPLVVGVEDSYSATEDQPLVVNAAQGLLANDLGFGLKAALVGSPVYGSVAIGPDGSFTYTPAANKSGSDIFSYQVTDGFQTSAPIAVSIRVQAVNDAPNAQGENPGTLPAGIPGVFSLASLLQNDTDVDGDTLSVASVQNALGGAVVLSGRYAIFTPTAGYTGNAGFSYTVSDGHGGTANAIVQFNLASYPLLADGIKSVVDGGALDDVLAAVASDGDGSVLNGREGIDSLTGANFDDILDGGTGPDVMSGGRGNDVYYVDDAGDKVTELFDQGNDKVMSAISYSLKGIYVENLTLTGSGNTAATGNSFANILIGNDGNNALDGLTGADNMSGGKGDDSYFVDDIGDVVTELSDGGTDTIYAALGYSLKGKYVENLTLTGTANTNATGNSFANVLNGNSGDNVIDGSTGADTMSGGKGNDSYFVDDIGDKVIERSGEGTDKVYASVSFSLKGQYIEHLTLTGNASLYGIGNSLANNLTGNSGANVLEGLAGNDILNGGLGADILTGGADRDIFLFASALGGGNIDLIKDYNLADDSIQLDRKIFTAISVGTLQANQFVNGTAALDADDRILYDAASGAVYYDPDGNGAIAAIQFATIGNHAALNAAEILIY